MRNAAILLLAVISITSGACKKKARPGTGHGNSVPQSLGPPSATSGSSGLPLGAKSGTPFLQGSRDIPARQEWNRDFGSRKGGTIAFRVSSPAPFALTIITEKGYRALTGKMKVDRSDVLLTINSQPPRNDGRVTVPPGMAWFIIENQSDSTAQIRLECYESN